MSAVWPIRRNRGSGSRAKPTEKQAYALPDEAGLVSDALVVVSILCIWLVLQLLVFGGWSEQRAQQRLYGQFRSELAQETGPTGGVIGLGRPVSLLTIRGTELVVSEGTDSRTLLSGPGHLRTTVLPGQAGASVVYGRARTYGRPFADIARLKVGTVIHAVTQQGRSTYTVTGIRRAGDPLPQPLTGQQGRLTLVTGDGSGVAGALSAGGVAYVDARLTSKAYSPPGGRYASVTSAEGAMARDYSVLPLLTLALAGLVAVVVAGSLLRRRVGSVLAWMLAGAPLIAMLWITVDLAMALLPNLV